MSRATEERDFDRWIEELELDVIQQEYGYEQGEFQVIPAMWIDKFCRLLTPTEAFAEALRDHAKAQKERPAP